MPKTLAVAVIHGMGSQGATKPAHTNDLVFSKGLKDRVRKFMGAGLFDQKVAWREIFWSHIMQPRQHEYLRAIKRRTRFDGIREFVVCNLSDAASYRISNHGNDTTYKDIHACVARTVSDLEQDVAPGSPLVVLAHSLGGHIMSNYIYDMGKSQNAPTSFQKLRTLGGLVTFGCNIPIFTFAYPRNQVFPITYPGVDLPPGKQLSSWWFNFYDKDDVLGYPLKDISPGYENLFASGALREKAINAGGFFKSWNPLSHTGYWKDADLYEPVARLLKKL